MSRGSSRAQCLFFGALATSVLASCASTERSTNKYEPRVEPLIRVTDGGSTGTSLFLAAHELQQRGRDDLALPLLLRARDLEPANPRVVNALGISCARTGDLSGALELFQKAVELENAGAEPYSNLGLTLVLLHRPSDALQPLRRAVDLDGGNSTARRIIERAMNDASMVAESGSAQTSSGDTSSAATPAVASPLTSSLPVMEVPAIERPGGARFALEPVTARAVEVAPNVFEIQEVGPRPPVAASTGAIRQAARPELIHPSVVVDPLPEEPAAPADSDAAGSLAAAEPPAGAALNADVSSITVTILAPRAGGENTPATAVATIGNEWVVLASSTEIVQRRVRAMASERLHEVGNFIHRWEVATLSQLQRARRFLTGLS